MAKPKRRRPRRRNPSGVGDFMHEHPWMTFFIVTGAISGIVTIIRGREPPIVVTPPSTTPPLVVTSSTPAASQLLQAAAPASVGDAEHICAAMFG